MEPGTPATTERALAGLRTAAADVAALAPREAGDASADDHAFDAAEHAGRFEELHEALSAVLDELERG